MKKLNLFALLVLGFVLVGCGDEKEITNWIGKTNGLLIEATKQSEIFPYQNPQYEALKAYYSELEVKIAAVKESKSVTEALNSVLAKMDLNDVCSKILMPKSQWDKVMKRCTKNRYFLCAEEVRAYPEAINAMVGLLNEEMKKKFSEAESCRGAL